MRTVNVSVEQIFESRGVKCIYKFFNFRENAYLHKNEDRYGAQQRDQERDEHPDELSLGELARIFFFALFLTFWSSFSLLTHTVM